MKHFWPCTVCRHRLRYFFVIVHIAGAT